MNRNLAESTLAGILLVIGFGVALHAPLSVWLGTIAPDFTEYIKAWKELLMGLSLVLLVVAAARRKMVRKLLDDRLMQIAAAYAALHVVMIAVLPQNAQAAGAGLLIDLRYVLFFVLVYGTVRLIPEFRRTFMSVIIGGATVVLSFGLLQMFVLPPDVLASIGYGKDSIVPYLTVDQNTDYIRINSSLRGPNPLAAYVVIIIALLAAYAMKMGKKIKKDERWVMVLAAVAAGLVIGATYSRSGFLALLISLLVVAGVASTSMTRRRLGMIAGIGIVGVAAILLITRSNPTVSSVVWHDDPATKSAVDSNEQHAESLADGTKRVIRRPLGEGVGTTGSASYYTKHPLIIENQYLFIAHETGWLGLGLFLWLFAEIMRRLWQLRKAALPLGVFASGLGLAFIGLMLPVWADDTVSIIWWGLAGVGLSYLAHFARKSAVRAQRTNVYASLTLLDFRRKLHSNKKSRGKSDA